MTCKIDHNADGALPHSLCATCNPVPAELKAKWDALARASVRQECDTDYSAIVRQRKLRKLRAEERRLSNLIDAVGPRDHAARKRLYDAIKAVEKEIDACGAKATS